MQVERALAGSFSSLKEKEKVTRRSFIKYDLRARIDKEGIEAKADLGYDPDFSRFLRHCCADCSADGAKLSVASFIFFSTSVNSFEQTNSLASHYSSLLFAGYNEESQRKYYNQSNRSVSTDFIAQFLIQSQYGNMGLKRQMS